MRRAIVGPTICVFHCVRQLVFDQVDAFAQDLVHNCPSRCPEAMRCYDFLAVPHAAKSGVDRIFTHAFLETSNAWENVLLVAGQAMQVAQMATA